MKILIDGWKQGYKFYSVWVFAVIAALPDLYNTLIASGMADMVPDQYIWVVRAVAALGIVSRFVSQKKPTGLPPEIEPVK